MIVVRHTITIHLSYSPNPLLVPGPGGKPHHNPGTHYSILYDYKSRYPSWPTTISKSPTKGGPPRPPTQTSSHRFLILFDVIIFAIGHMRYSHSYTIPIDLPPAPPGAIPHQFHKPIPHRSNAKSRRPLHPTLPHLIPTNRLYTAPRQPPVQQYLSPSYYSYFSPLVWYPILYRRSFPQAHIPRDPFHVIIQCGHLLFSSLG